MGRGEVTEEMWEAWLGLDQEVYDGEMAQEITEEILNEETHRLWKTEKHGN